MISKLFHMSLLFWIVTDPIGNVPIFVGVLRQFDPQQQRRIILRELLIALAFMILFLFFGKGFFTLLHISDPSVQIAGGTILCIIAIRMLFSTPQTEKNLTQSHDPLIVPLAVPAIAGPGILATLTLYGGTGESKIVILVALIIAWLGNIPILLFAPSLKKHLGPNGIVAIERLFGYIIILIAAQLTLGGIATTFFNK